MPWIRKNLVEADRTFVTGVTGCILLGLWGSTARFSRVPFHKSFSIFSPETNPVSGCGVITCRLVSTV